MRGLLTATMVFVLASASCDECDWPGSDCETVNVDDVYWSAYRNPESFDAALPTMELHPRTSEVFRLHGQDRFAKANAKLDERDQFELYSPLWRKCDEEAIELHNQGVVFRDIMLAIDRTVPFSSSETGMALIFGKTYWETRFGPGSWAALVAQARSLAAPLEWEFH